MDVPPSTRLAPRPPARSRDRARTALLAAAACAGLSALLAACESRPGQAPAALTTTPAVRALRPSDAGGHPVRLSGRVTYFDGDWRILALQDATGSILVDSGENGYLTTDGEELVLQGITAVHDGQVVVASPSITSVARHPRVVGPPTPVRQVLDGRCDGCRVEVRGTLLEATMTQGRLRGVLQADGAPLVVWVRQASVSDARQLVGHEVRAPGVPLRATAAARRRGESELFVDTQADLLLVIPPGVASTVITDAASVRG